jgi:pimeloyl-ACP methyl ester carboxylesterase
MTGTQGRPLGMRLLDPRPLLLEMRRAAVAARDGGTYVRANGIDIHYVEEGSGPPLVLLNNGMISTSPVWADWVSSYVPHRPTLSAHFRVIEADFRGSGRTVHPGGPISYDLLVEDLMAFVDAMDLDRPLVAGYGDGAHVATIAALREPDAFRAVVNHGGFDLFTSDADTPALRRTREMLGGRPDATQADPDAVLGVPFLRPMVEKMQADHDAAQGEGHWKTVLTRTFERVSQPCGYTLDDLRSLTAPTLIMVGDRDWFCPVEDAVVAYRALPDGELAVLPNMAVGNSPAATRTILEFCQRRAALEHEPAALH